MVSSDAALLVAEHARRGEVHCGRRQWQVSQSARLRRATVPGQSQAGVSGKKCGHSRHRPHPHRRRRRVLMPTALLLDATQMALNGDGGRTRRWLVAMGAGLVQIFRWLQSPEPESTFTL